jgi:hypothetical protein
MRITLIVPVLVAAMIGSAAALAADEPSFELSLKDHQFTPGELTVPADKRLKLTIKNLDTLPAEFESHDFKAEKIVPAGGEVSVYIGPLKAGTYGFFDDFHGSTKGSLIAK